MIINENKPWLKQLSDLRKTLIKKALDESNGDKKKAIKKLGCSISHLNKEIRENEYLYDYRFEPSKTKHNEDLIMIAIQMGYSFTEIANTLGSYREYIREVAKRNLPIWEYKNIIAKNKKYKTKGKKMLTTEDILNNNRVILAEIAEKIRENKVNELSDEHITYAKILFQNGFITEKGEVTEEGKNALYQ